MRKGSGVCVVGSEFCSPKMVELAVVRRVMPKPDSTILIGNNNNDIIFKIDDTTSTIGIHKKRLLLDSIGTPILTFRHKIKSLHYRWKVYKGSSTDKKDLIFTAKQSKMFGSNRELIVFLATNKRKKTCDFKVGASSDVIYAGDSHSDIIAEMRDYTVKVHAYVDQAFIISLIVILDVINQQRSEKKAHVSGLAQAAFGII